MQGKQPADLFTALQSKLTATISSAKLAPRRLPLCPDVQLYLLTDDFPKGPLPHDEMLAVLNEPAYWAFCWASGQVLGRYILTHSDTFKGKTVLDFGAGSGAVGIAAALAGAKRVICCDIDPAALLASEANAALNGVEVELLPDIHQLGDKVDWLIAADVLYDRENFPLISALPQYADQVLIADSRVKSDRLTGGDWRQEETHQTSTGTGTARGYKIVDRVTATTIPDLDEFKEFNDVRVYLAR